MSYRAKRQALAREKAEMTTNSRLFTLLLAYFAFEYVRFQESYLPFLSPLHIPMFIILALAFIVLQKKDEAFKDKVIRLALIFLLEMAIWVPFTRNNFWAYQVVKSMSMLLVTVLATYVIIQDTTALIKLMKAFVVICLLEAIWIITHNGHGPGGFVQDQNDVCMVMDVVTPFAWYLAFRRGISAKEKFFFLGAFVIFFIAMVITDSRGGMLGYVAAILAIMVWSKNPLRNILVSVVFAASLGGLALKFLPPAYVADMETITNKNDDTRNLRLLHWTTAWAMFKANPVFGVGPGNYPWNSQYFFKYSPYYNPHSRNRAGRQAHSLYFTLIPEEGLVGIMLFLSMLFISAKRIITVKRSGHRRRTDSSQDKESQDLVLIAKMLAGGFSGYLIAGAFISVLYYPILWHLLAFTAVLWKLYERENSVRKEKKTLHEGKGFASTAPLSVSSRRLNKPKHREAGR